MKILFWRCDNKSTSCDECGPNLPVTDGLRNRIGTNAVVASPGTEGSEEWPEKR